MPTMIEMQPIESKALKAVGYSASESVLQVQFPGGERWRYYHVPPQVYQALLDAASAGTYFRRAIRNVYPSRRV